MPILRSVEAPEPLTDLTYDTRRASPRRRFAERPSLWGLGERATWISGLVLALSALTGWYAGSGEGVNVAVLGWHTGLLGKLVLFIGLAAILVVVLRQCGFDLPAAVPESLIVIALGALSTIFVLVRAISIPDEFFFARSRGRALDQPRRLAGADRRRPAASIRRALARPSRNRQQLLRRLDQRARVERLADEALRAAGLGFGGGPLVDLAART